jgi:hypothetical protein
VKHKLSVHPLVLVLAVFGQPFLLLAVESQDQARLEPLGLVCVDGISKNERWDANQTGATEKSIFTVQIDDLPPTQISTASAGVFTNLSTSAKHLVKISVDGRPLTSFRFTFQESQSDHLRLWYNPFYGTWSLSPTDKRHKCAYLQ